MTDKTMNQHKRLAMGESINVSRSSKPRGYSHGGLVAQMAGSPQKDSTTFQKYGMGYRKVKAK